MSTFENAIGVIRHENDQAAASLMEKVLDENPILVRATDSEGFTLLHHAARRRNGMLVTLLLDRGADPNALNFNGDSPLLLTADGESTLQLHQRIATETDTWRKDLSARADQHYALVEEVEELIHLGNAQDAIARLQAHPELVHAWFPPNGPLLHMAAYRGRNCQSVVNFMLTRAANPNATDRNGKTPLHRLMQRPVDTRQETPDLMDLLLRHGADINRKDNDGWTPLHEAAYHSTWEERVKLLVERGADINTLTNDGESALDIVRSMRFMGSRGLAQWMKKNGAQSGKE